MSDSKIHILQLELSNYVRPDIKVNYGQDWVYNGKKNEFFQYIIDRFNGSATNSAIINSNKDLMYGRGLADQETEEKIEDDVEKILPKKEVKRILADYALFTATAFIVKWKGKKIETIEHIPRESILPNKVNEKGEIDTYWHCFDWTNTYKYKPEAYPAFGTTQKGDEILMIKPYNAGEFYFENPDYMAGLQYAEAEEEISNFSINHIKNGLSFGHVINFNNGATLSAEEKDEYEKKVISRTTGSNNANSVILSFNNSKENEVTVTSVENTDVYNRWEILAKECSQKILTAHRVTNPILVGIKENTGLGNNADEMDVAEHQYLKRVIAPKQEIILDTFKEILKINGIDKDLYFLPLTELDEQGDSVNSDDEKVEENEAPVKEDKKEKTELKKHTCELSEIPLDLCTNLIGLGEDISDEWELISEAPVNYDTCDIEDEALQLTVVDSSPDTKSEQDKGLFKVRYKYFPATLTKNEKGEVISRGFCKEMIEANKVYRKEDIKAVENKAVNKGWGLNGADTYDIWLYKGGGSCHHFWQRQVYFRKRTKSGTFKPNKGLENDEKVSVNEARKRGVPIEKNAKEVATRPTDMPKHGFVNKFKKMFRWQK